MGAYADKRWHIRKGSLNYIAEVEGLTFELWKDTGNKETTFGKKLSARHFLEKEKWQNHIREIFGLETYTEIYDYLKNAQEEHEAQTRTVIE
jgi:hypothetical protein